MIEWFKNNVSWVFSGIGVAVIAVVAGGVVNWWRNGKNKKPGNSGGPPQLARVYAATPLPAVICADVGSRPPYQQHQAGEAYKGHHYRWTLGLFDVKLDVDDKNRALVSFWQDKPLTVVYVRMSLDDCPMLKTAQRDTRFWVAGTISKATDDHVTLDEATVTPA